MLNGMLEAYQIDNERGLLEGEVLLNNPYEMTTLEMNIFGTKVYITPFDITRFRIVQDKLGISFSVIVSMQALHRILNEIAIRN